jgi:hypothetical protein
MQNYYVAIKAEPVSIGVPDATVTGAAKMRLNALTAPELAQALINPGEIRSDGKTPLPRLGSKSGTATLPADLRYTEHDPYLEAAVRSTWATDTLVSGVTKRSYTIETYEQDIDTSVLSKGFRFGGFRISGAPDEPVHIEYPGMFIDQAVLGTGASPFYTSPTLGTTDYMVVTDCVIEVDSVPVLDLTSFDFTFDNGLSLQKVVGSKLSPNVYADNSKITGSISALRTSAARQSAYLAGTQFAFVVTCEDPDGNQMVFTFPNVLGTNHSLPLGNAGPPVVSIPVVGGVVGTDEMVQIDRVDAA